jgi:hypothetical protein
MVTIFLYHANGIIQGNVIDRDFESNMELDMSSLGLDPPNLSW